MDGIQRFLLHPDYILWPAVNGARLLDWIYTQHEWPLPSLRAPDIRLPDSQDMNMGMRRKPISPQADPMSSRWLRTTGTFDMRRSSKVNVIAAGIDEAWTSDIVSTWGIGMLSGRQQTVFCVICS